MAEREAHETAEVLVEEHGLPEYPEEDDRSMPVEVLLELDSLNFRYITREDVPAILRFLSTPAGEAEQGWREWRRYWQSVDWEKRREELKDNLNYSIRPMR